MPEYFDRIAALRRRTADQLEQLDDEQLATRSLCDAWTVRDVAAHLTTGWNIGIPKFAVGMLRERGNFDKANIRFTRELAKRPTSEIIADLRANADHRFTPPGAGSEAPLADIIVHGQDMFIPLDIDFAVDTGDVAAVLELVRDRKWDRITGTTVGADFAMQATDSDWSYENPGKPVLEAPALELLLMWFGRTSVNE